MTERLPKWLRPRAPKRQQLATLGNELSEMGVHTVCQSARCPNVGECFARRQVTFMIMGDICTRNCRFCAVAHGPPAPLDCGEPRRVAEAAKRLGLRHVVVTSVTRDDLPDGGAAHFAATIAALRDTVPGAAVEVLVPDFQGSRPALSTVVEGRPEVFGHNVEMVPRLYHSLRPQADYHRSLALLREAREMRPELLTKSGFMVGLGETEDEVVELLRGMRDVGVRAVTMGQYLQPTRRSVPVFEYVAPETFARYGEIARDMGFPHVASGPLVRSSYHADELLEG